MSSPLTDAQRAHLGLRLVLGLNIFMHGAVRFGHLSKFVDGVVQGFATTALPAGFVLGFAYAIPFLEVAIGALVLAGFRFREATLAGFALIAALTFGTCLREQWDIAGLQLIYALAYFALTLHASHLRYAVDGRVARQ